TIVLLRFVFAFSHLKQSYCYVLFLLSPISLFLSLSVRVVRWSLITYLLCMPIGVQDFYMEMHWSFECSNVLAPIVKAVAPHDHYRIWKKGSWLRMDSTITG
ncbi:unnamed protein product, partial [Laminaria digitata]